MEQGNIIPLVQPTTDADKTKRLLVIGAAIVVVVILIWFAVKSRVVPTAIVPTPTV